MTMNDIRYARESFFRSVTDYIDGINDIGLSQGIYPSTVREKAKYYQGKAQAYLDCNIITPCEFNEYNTSLQHLYEEYAGLND